MGILQDFEKDRLWDRMTDMEVLGMTRDDLDHEGLMDATPDRL